MSELQLMKSAPAKGGLIEIEQQRAIQEVQASLIIAKKFRRDTDESYTRIIQACSRKTLATSAMYAYPRGNQMVTGPSIRLAETIAQNWGNLNFGIRELSQENGESEVEAFAWDLETNTKQVKIFRVPHIRYSRNKGNTALTDPRDIYEMVANQGARRLRACILGVIPGDIIDAAVAQCEKTLREESGVPIKDRVRNMLTAFDKFGVTKDMIERRLCHNTDAIIETELVELIKIYTSLRDGMSKREDWFDISTASDSQESKDLTDELQKGKTETDNGKGPGDEQPEWDPAKEPVQGRYLEDKRDILEKVATELSIEIKGLKSVEIHQAILDHHKKVGDDNEILERFNGIFEEKRGTPAWHHAQGVATGGENNSFKPIAKAAEWLAAYDEYTAQGQQSE